MYVCMYVYMYKTYSSASLPKRVPVFFDKAEEDRS